MPQIHFHFHSVRPPICLTKLRGDRYIIFIAAPLRQIYAVTRSASALAEIDAGVFRLPNLPDRLCPDRAFAIACSLRAWKRARLLRLGYAREISPTRLS